MFLAEDVVVGTGFRQAQARFVSLLHGNWLAKASDAAYGETVTGLLRVGPAGGVATKLVQVSFLDPLYAPGGPQIHLRRSGPHWHLAKAACEQYWLRRWA